MDSFVGKDIRISNIFHASGNAFIVALDHGILMGPVEGIENIVESVANIIKGHPDAIQVTPPVARILKHNFLGRNSPSLVVRLDSSNLWRKKPEPKQGYYSDIFSVLSHEKNVFSLEHIRSELVFLLFYRPISLWKRDFETHVF